MKPDTTLNDRTLLINDPRYVPDHLNLVWMKKNCRIPKNKAYELAMHLDEGWKIHENTKEYIHLIYTPEHQLLSAYEICYMEGRGRRPLRKFGNKLLQD